MNLTELSESVSIFEELIGTKGNDTPEFYNAAEVVVNAAKAYLAEERNRIYGLESSSTVDLSTATGLKGSFTDQNSFGLVEKPRTFREKLADLMEEEGAYFRVEKGRFSSVGTDGILLNMKSEIETSLFIITPEMLRGKAE